jgi:cardiolipin synthase
MTIPNILTFGRIFLTPVLIWLLLDARLKAALVVFFIAGLTDGLDGFIARVFNQKSQLGAYLDPLADKLLLVSSFILLAYIRLIPSWVVIIAVSRDVIIVAGMVTLMLFDIPVRIQPSYVSKATTLVQLLTVLCTMGSSIYSLPGWAYKILFWGTALLSVASGIHYTAKGISILDSQWSRSGR